MTYDILDAAREQSDPKVDFWVHRAVEKMAFYLVVNDPNLDTIQEARSAAIHIIDKLTKKIDDHLQHRFTALRGQEG